jgi:hypothetical protein
MSAAHFAHRLARLEAFLRTKPPGFAAEDALAIADGLDRYFAQRCSLDAAMGVHLDQGEKHPGTSLARAMRDANLRAAAARLGELTQGNSKKLAEMLASYEAGAWRRDKGEKSCPQRLAGRIEAHLWGALKALPRVVGERQMHFIVEAQSEVKSAFDFRAADGVSNPPKG